MPKLRVYEMPGNEPVRVLHPNEKLRGAGESDDAFLARMAARAEEADPTLTTAVTHLDVDEAVINALPRSQAGKHARNAWRLNPAKTGVVVNPVELARLPVDPRLI